MKRLCLALVICLVLCAVGPSAELTIQSIDVKQPETEYDRCGEIQVVSDALESAESEQSILSPKEISEPEVSFFESVENSEPFEESGVFEESTVIEEAIVIEESIAEETEISEEPEEHKPRISQPEQYFVYDSSKGVVSHTGELDGMLYMASITKLYTVHIALKYLKPNELLTVGGELGFVAFDASVAGLERGDVLTVEQLIAGALLPSGNDAAYVLAVAAGRKILNKPNCREKLALDAFIAEMNRRAKLDGMKSTRFVNPDGYHNDGHYTSMNDVLTISKIAIENDLIIKYTSMREFEVVLGERTLKWHNTNMLIHPESELYRKNVIGLKTGFTDRAGACIVVAEKIGNRTVIVGVFGCDSMKARYEEAYSLLKRAA